MQGTLKIWAARARGLRGADRSGTSDPYVTFTVGSTERKSKTKPKTLEPSWEDETFTFGSVRPDDPVVVRVYDANLASRDELIGQVTMVASAAPTAAGATEVVLSLRDQGKPGGTFTAHMLFVGPPPAAVAVSAAMQAPASVSAAYDEEADLLTMGGGAVGGHLSVEEQGWPLSTVTLRACRPLTHCCPAATPSSCLYCTTSMYAPPVTSCGRVDACCRVAGQRASLARLAHTLSHPSNDVPRTPLTPCTCLVVRVCMCSEDGHDGVAARVQHARLRHPRR
jgi:hypothetical protein